MTGFDMKSISVIERNHPQYADMDVRAGMLTSRHTSTKFYNEVVEALNSIDVDTIILVPIPEKIAYFNLRNVMRKRGLVHGEDILITRQEVGPDGERIPTKLRPAKIKKISKTKGTVIDSYPKAAQDG
jgi:hypothetical protein